MAFIVTNLVDFFKNVYSIITNINLLDIKALNLTLIQFEIICSIKCGIAQQSRFISSPRSAFRQRRDRFSVKLRKMALPAASFEHYIAKPANNEDIQYACLQL